MLRAVEFLVTDLLQICQGILQCKNIENRSRFYRIMATSLWSHFFGLPCRVGRKGEITRREGFVKKKAAFSRERNTPVSAPGADFATDCAAPHLMSATAMNSSHETLMQGCSGAGTRGDGVPPLFSTGGRVPHSSHFFWTEIRAQVSPLLKMVTYLSLQ